MSVLKWITLAAGLRAVVPSIAQDQGTGKVRLLVQPWHQVVFLLDDRHERFTQVSALDLAPGAHHFTFWAPDRTIWDTTVNVVAGQDLELRKVLPGTPEYLAYKKEHHQAWVRKTAWKAAPLLATLGAAAWVMVNKAEHDQAYEDLHALADSYDQELSPSVIDGLKDQKIPEAEERLADSRQRLGLSIAVCSVSAAVTVYGFLRAKRIPYPAYEDHEKIRFEGLSWAPGPAGGTLLTGLSIPLR